MASVNESIAYPGRRCQSARKRTPGSACKRDPFVSAARGVQVANRRALRAPRSAFTSDGAARVGGACLPTWATRWVGPGRALIAAEASRRFDRLEFVEIEFVDGLQGLSGGAVLKVVGQSLEPAAVFGLEGDEDSNGIAPALSAAAMVGRSPVADHRPGCGAGSAMPGLSLGIGHWFLAKRRVGHGFTPKRYVTEPANRQSRGLQADQARCLKRQLSLPVSMISQWWVRRSSNAVVILASPNTLGHSPKARLVVTMMEVRS